MEQPRGLNSRQPRFTWAVKGDGHNRRQTAYRIVVGTDADAVGQGDGDLWDTGKIASSDSILIPYAGRRLVSDRRIYWAVEVWDEADVQSYLSLASDFWTGLLDQSDWRAAWIARYFVPPEGYEPPADTVYDNPWRARPADYMRSEFSVQRPIRRATLYASALGVYEAYINGERVGDEVLAPGWTDYHTRVEYQLYDVTDLLRSGANAIAAVVGEGWYCGRIGMSPKKAGAHYGGRPVFIAQLHLEYDDGSFATIVTDETWKTSNEAIVYSDLLIGEKYDARLEQPGWSLSGFDDSKWQKVEKWDPIPRAPKLDASRVQPIRKTLELPVQYVGTRASGEMIFDLGQNVAGHLRLSIQAPRGSTFVLRHAEMLTPEGDLYTTNLRDAPQTDVYIAKGQGKEVFEPRFTYHGFQYVGITAPEGVRPDDLELTGIAVHSDTPLTGSFECGQPMVNKLFSNILWSQRDNFISVPTDCPQRNERLGWLADAQIFLRTAGFNMDVAAFFTKWMVDVEDTETDGGFADIAPSKAAYAFITEPPRGAPAWGDAAVIMPWLIYLRYGDKEILERHYPALVRWMDLIERHNPDFIRNNYVNRDYGDWLNIGPATPRPVVNTAYWGHLADLMSRIAHVLGRRTDEARFRSVFRAIQEAFQDKFIDADGRITGDTQTAYLLALYFGLLEGQRKQRAVQHLIRTIDEADGHLQTGFLGVKHLCPVLSDSGAHDRAYALLLKDTYPSWGFSIRHGATTIWERWDGWTPERGFQSPNMNSFNHYAYGAVGEWMFSRVGGIDYDETAPGFRRVRMRPVFNRTLGWCHAEYRSQIGPVISHWVYEGDQVKWNISVPANCSALITLPRGMRLIALNSAATKEAISPVYGGGGLEDDRLELGSGEYVIVVRETMSFDDHSRGLL
ncbi:alpha-L-rhamnosidase [Microvirga sp. VF16]|uniref:alpha-L-rhamnosidase n=1 Tax=Microvirga sp. VF16 TaxID=2807101 RepID=UPI00193E0153|nr:alpha-L-rhamnosidase [Microvirga sp. VF16]QRM29203.1 family 78 glycoside hydrolase catalytic domain [Microvirga sp. VF16]